MTFFDVRLRQAGRPVRGRDEAVAAGRALRQRLPRSAHAAFAPIERDPLALLDVQNAARVPELVPIRMARMAAGPFAFFRGTAALMAHDLAGAPTTGLDVLACGDAHLANFGLYSSPQRTLVFDLNDFDEASVAPWEWDVKRLLTSIVIAAQANGYETEATTAAALAAAAAYRRTMRELAGLDAVTRYFFQADTDLTDAKRTKQLPLAPAARRVLDRAVKAALRRTADRTLLKITETDAAGRLRIVEQPPVLTRLDPELAAKVDELLAEYLQTVPVDIAVLLSQFEVADVARRVVGVGSVGTRCYIVVLAGPVGEPIILQVKEAPRSALDRFGGLPAPTVAQRDGGIVPLFRSEGHRVVACQRVLQAVSDPFLGWFSNDGRDFYVRQYRDRKGSIETEGLTPEEFTSYVRACGARLARAHSQSAAGTEIAGYLGGSPAFDRAAVAWAEDYARQSRRDFDVLRAAIDRGEVPVIDA